MKPMHCPKLLKQLQKHSKFFKAAVFIVGVASLFAVSLYRPQEPVMACNTINECEEEINKITDFLNQHRDATKNLEVEVTNLEQRIASARAGVAAAQAESEQLAEEIEEREEDLAYQYKVLSKRIAIQYKRMRIFSPLLLIFSSTDAKELTKDLAYRNSAKAQDNKLIQGLGAEIAQLEEDKNKLEQDQIALANLEAQLDEQAEFLRGEIAEAKEFHEDLEGQIAELSARQQEIINARSGGFTASIGDSELADDYKASIKGFRESAPSGSFAVFSFGAYTHRKGMSQYGARGRAESGQDYKKILEEYYGKGPVEKDTGGTISVAGHGNLEFESDYLYGIAEMPSSWHVEALKAQAIAARTYAYRYKRDGKEICTTEACQVFRKSKSDNPPSAWKEAVDATKGEILEDVVTYYASTHGGFASPIGWDTTDGGGGSNFIDKSYDKIGGSPWLYKAWWREGYSSSGDTCGRSDPWLSPEEMADIVNAYLVITKGSTDEAERISPVTTSCWGGDPYSHSELQSVAGKYGGISSATSVSVTQGNGSTSTVTINGISMSGGEFKKAFNLRAPGRLRIPQSSFAFFNIEHK